MRVVTSGGEDIILGTTETTPTISIIDYSRRETDDFGVTTVVERGFARRLSVRMSIPPESVDSVQQILAGLRATSAHWIADDDYLWLNVEGFYKEFELDFATPALSYCTLTVEGLAETELVADAGGDPAPLGTASTLRLLQPVTVTDAVLAASNVPENDYPEWAAGTTYALGARVIKASLHRIFESAGAGNVGHDPAALSGEWIDIGPTNRWAMFDQALGSATAKASPLAVTLAAGKVNAVALLDVVGTSVRVQTTGYDQTKAVGSGAIIFLDIPATGAAVTVTVTGVGTSSAGTLLVGTLVSLGITETSPTAGITDFSKKDVDEFGEVTVVPRAWAKRMAAKALIRSDSVDVVANRLAAVRAVPSLWIADEDTDSLTVYGFFKDFSLEVGEGVSILSLSVEGLSKAETINPLAVTDLAGTGTLATDDYVYFGTGGTIKEAIGGADATLPGFRTDLGTAAAIAGQGSGATANNLTQLNPTEGTKLGTVATGATKNRTFYGSPDPATVPANAVADGDKWIDATVVPNIYKERLGGAWVDAAARGAQTGVSLYRDTGSLLTQADVRTAEGTAAAIAGQGALATKSAVAYGTGDVTGFGSLAARSNVRLQNEVYRADGATLLTDAAAVTSLGTAAAITGQGAFATLSSAAYGSSLLTGFGTVAARNNVRIGTELVRADGITATSDAGLVTSLGTAAAISGQGSYATLSQTYFGDGLLKETSGGVTATLANFKTSSGTAAGISGQGALATKSTVTYGTGDVSGFGTLAARANVRLGTEVVRADGATLTTDAMLVTSLGTAAAISGQGAFATVSSAAYGSALLTGFGTLAPRNNVRIGTELVRADGATATSDAALVTSLGTAAGISGQGSLATKSTVTYGTGDVTGFGALAAKSTATYGTGDVTGFGTLAARANVRLGTEVVRADGVTSASDATVVTSLGTAAAIAGQGALATASSADFSSQVSGSTKPSNRATADVAPSPIGASPPSVFGNTVTRMVGGGDMNCAAVLPPIHLAGFIEVDRAATGETIIALDDDASSTALASQKYLCDTNGTVGQLFVDGAGQGVVNAGAASGVLRLSYTGERVIMFSSTGGKLAEYPVLPGLTLYPKVWAYEANKVVTGVKTGFASAGGEPGADITSIHTASAIAGQGALATANYSYYGTGGTIKEALGGADATLANFKTASGTAAGISGQGTGATANNLSQLNGTEGTKFAGIEASADLTRILTVAAGQSIQYDYSGTTSSQVPVVLTNIMRAGGAIVTPSTSFSYSASGCTVDTVGCQTGQVRLTGVSANNASIIVTGTYLGVARSDVIPVQLVLGQNPGGSGGGGGGSTGFSVDVSASITDTTYDGTPQPLFTGTAQMRSNASGQIRLTISASYQANNNQSAQIIAKARRSTDGINWTDTGLSVTGTVSQGGYWVDSNGNGQLDVGDTIVDGTVGSISANSLVSGFTASTDYYIQWIGYKAGSQGTVGVTGTASGAQS